MGIAEGAEDFVGLTEGVALGVALGLIEGTTLGTTLAVGDSDGSTEVVGNKLSVGIMDGWELADGLDVVVGLGVSAGLLLGLFGLFGLFGLLVSGGSRKTRNSGEKLPPWNSRLRNVASLLLPTLCKVKTSLLPIVC